MLADVRAAALADRRHKRRGSGAISVDELLRRAERLEHLSGTPRRIEQ